MRVVRKFSIKGVGSHLPQKKVESSELEQQLNLPAGWIYKHMGVNTRYVATTETGSSMGASALQAALLDANLKIEEIDFLIAASATFDYVLPNRSSLIKAELGVSNDLDFPCIDINSVCTSFISAVDYASYLFTTGEYKNIAIVSSEIGSKGLVPQNIEPYCLFGDAAAAVILSKTEREAGLIKYSLKNYAENAKDTIIEGGGNVHHPRDQAYDPLLHSFKMEGKKLLRTAGKQLPLFLDSFYSNIPTTLCETDWIVPHQASKMGLKMLERLNGRKSENIANQLAEYGNCIAASIPHTFVNQIRGGKIKEGDNCLFIGTAAGLSICGLLFKYSKG